MGQELCILWADGATMEEKWRCLSQGRSRHIMEIPAYPLMAWLHKENHIPIKPSHKLDVNPQLELVSVHLLQVRGKTKNFLNYRVYQPFLNLPKCSSPN